MKLLIPIDGSNGALRAVTYIAEHRDMFRESPTLLLLNVQWKVATGNVKLFINQDVISDYYREQGLAALQPARDVLDAAQLPYQYHVSVGTPAESVAQYAREQCVDQIVMCRQGQGGLQLFLLGSVVTKVLHLAQCPVLLVK
ncbi:MAG: universal stress protein [Proteobacteria bacterium]|nr:universal stress protein [Pseudomonadota bacterium]